MMYQLDRLLRVTAIFLRELRNFASLNLGVLLFCVFLVLLLLGKLGAGMGIPGLLRNPYELTAYTHSPETLFNPLTYLDLAFWGSVFFTPSFWTAFFTYYLSFVVFVVVRYWEARRSDDATPKRLIAPGMTLRWPARLRKLAPRIWKAMTHSKAIYHGRRTRQHLLRQAVWRNRTPWSRFWPFALAYSVQSYRTIFLFGVLMLAWLAFDGLDVSRPTAFIDAGFGLMFGYFFTILVQVFSLWFANRFITLKSFDPNSAAPARQAMVTDGTVQMFAAMLIYVVFVGANNPINPINLSANVYLFLLIILVFMIANFMLLFFSYSRWVLLALVPLYLILPAQDLQQTRFDGIVDRHGVDHYNSAGLLSSPNEERRLHLARRQAEAPMSPHVGAKLGEFSPTGDSERCVNDADNPYFLRPVDALEAWRRHHVAKGTFKRKLVIVSTSGGAYRAAYWTAMILDELTRQSHQHMSWGGDGKLKGFDDSIRLITGASGGMVAGTYFLAMAQEEGRWPVNASVEARLDHDIKVTTQPNQFMSNIGLVSRDSLTQVAKHIIASDLPNLLNPFGELVDRGKVLQEQWLTLDTNSFGDMVQGQIEGWRPSIIFSPMLVETGQPILISNLDLRSMPQFRGNEAEVFFDLFPCSQRKFSLATAVRMNATFPYISPAVSLPTIPERRVVDAGYYDNYGISTAAAYLSDPGVRKWIEREIDDVILLEVRAFPVGLSGELACGGRADVDLENVDDLLEQVKNPALASTSIASKLGTGSIGARATTIDDKERDYMADQTKGVLNSWANLLDEKTTRMEQFEWLSNPFEAAFSARSASMVFRNSQALDKVRSLYSDTRINNVVFVNNTDVSLNWYLTDAEVREMRACFDSQWTENYPTLTWLWER